MAAWRENIAIVTTAGKIISKINVFKMLLCTGADMVTAFRATLVGLFAHETQCSKQDK